MEENYLELHKYHYHQGLRSIVQVGVTRLSPRRRCLGYCNAHLQALIGRNIVGHRLQIIRGRYLLNVVETDWEVVSTLPLDHFEILRSHSKVQEDFPILICLLRLRTSAASQRFPGLSRVSLL